MKRETPPALRFIDDALAQTERDGLMRVRRAPSMGSDATFCSNDYLALARLPPPSCPSGAGASRLITGERQEHVDVERLAADFVGLQASLAFTSGYAANVGVLAALVGAEDLVISDALNHASIVDGVRLSKARVAVVPHLDVSSVEAALKTRRRRRALVVTESYFSMDADAPDLVALRALCDAHGAALMVDEAHALGVLGPEGRGLCARAGVQPDVLVGTFGKAFGAGGAFAAGCPSLVTWLWNRARTFVFSTGLSPAIASAAARGLRCSLAEPQRRERALAAAQQLRDGMRRLNIVPGGFGHIIPWVFGDPARALSASAALKKFGVDVCAIRPPSVPIGTSRLRFAVTASHGTIEIESALDAISRLRRDQR